MYKISHHGAVNGVTGSCHELTLDSGASLLIDCGLFQGAESMDREADSVFVTTQIDFDIAPVKALLVTHCHIDHVGRIPYLIAAGFRGPIYATEATAKLLPLVLEDALKVGVTRDEALINTFLRLLNQQLVPVPYDVWFAPEELVEVKARFRVAGHILGSAYVELDIGSAKRSQDRKRVVFSGDLGAPYSPLLPAPKSPFRCDELIIESTYGDRQHEGRRMRRKRLQQTVERCLKNKGTVLIPAFSIGRTQELLYELEEIIHRAVTKRSKSKQAEQWQHLDIIVDSPLASGFTAHYRALKTLWDAEARAKVKAGRHPLSFEQLITISSHQEHMQTVNYLAQSGRAAIVIAASGMCAGGRMQNYLKALLPDPRTDVVFIGYQAKGTPGRDIQTYGPRGGFVYLDGQKIEIQAGVYTLGGYSAHADQKDLVNFVKRMRYKPDDIRIVHGDDEAKATLKRKFLDVVPTARIVIPNA
ncbi:MBL fold metallo-hydrolase RNA specificity domain-containing protein [Thalassolituus oleivorans]|uniref:MBL fold metallo-hydrolase RNA specificity domain-containing protein n=1 Tax=Thalassolituus oleivorans TaxID=187493 RepID=UPI0023F49B3F|nr:MBL fold metallo-hydrolase [Thalassolituus oleivorans]